MVGAIPGSGTTVAANVALTTPSPALEWFKGGIRRFCGVRRREEEREREREVMVDTFDRYTLGGEYFRWYRGVPVALPVRGRFKAYWSGPARSWWSISRQRTHSISFPLYIVLISHGIFSTSLSLSLCLRRNSIFCLITLAQREREREKRVPSLSLITE